MASAEFIIRLLCLESMESVEFMYEECLLRFIASGNLYGYTDIRIMSSVT